MKRVLPAVLTLLLAVTLVLLYQSRQAIADLETKLARLEAPAHKPPPPAAPRTTARAPSGTPAAGSPSTEDRTESEPAREKEPSEKPGTDAADLLLGGAGKKEIAERSKARIALLRDRLKLRPDQIQALEKAAADRSDALLAAFERIRQNKGTPPDLGLMVDWMLGHHDLPAPPGLDAAQTETLAGMSASERTSRVENMVNMELLELQSQGGLHLTPEQKDQAFTALSGIVADEDTLGAAYYADDSRFMARIEESFARRRAALAAVLDESMMQSYDKMLAQDREQIISLAGGGAKKDQ